MDNRKILGIIPARAGSKRVPKKNMHKLNGVPLIMYTIKAAKAASLLDRVILSSDDDEIIRFAMEHQIEVPFKRPSRIAGDRVTDFDWVSHAVTEFEKNDDPVGYIVILRPTSPLRKSDDIDNAVKAITSGDYDSVRSLTKVTRHPFWMKRLQGDLAIPFIDLGRPDETLRSQDLPDLYYLNGLVDIVKRENIESGRLYGSKMGYILIEEYRALDIDTKEDVELAEYRLQKNY